MHQIQQIQHVSNKTNTEPSENDPILNDILIYLSNDLITFPERSKSKRKLSMLNYSSTTCFYEENFSKHRWFQNLKFLLAR